MLSRVLCIIALYITGTGYSQDRTTPIKSLIKSEVPKFINAVIKVPKNNNNKQAFDQVNRVMRYTVEPRRFGYGAQKPHNGVFDNHVHLWTSSNNQGFSLSLQFIPDDEALLLQEVTKVLVNFDRTSSIDGIAEIKRYRWRVRGWDFTLSGGAISYHPPYK